MKVFEILMPEDHFHLSSFPYGV